MAMIRTTHDLCTKKGFLRSSTSGSYTRFNNPDGGNHWVGRCGTKTEQGWQARRYPKGTSGTQVCTYWEGPIVVDPITAFATGELAQWGG
jgi:hypothetical protein